MEKKNITFSDDISESGFLSQNGEDQNIEEKPLTAPQFQRLPVFTYKNSEKGLTSVSSKLPSRPSTSNRPSSRPSSRRNRAQSPTNSLENRILIKLASVLPNGETEFTTNQAGRLPESRNTLLKLNTELDEMIKDIRELNTEHGKYLIANLYDNLKDTTNTELPTINAETGHLLYDVIISELTNQAYRKIMRINKFYRHHLVLQRNHHQQERQAFLLEIEELKSQLHTQRLYQIEPIGQEETLRSHSESRPSSRQDSPTTTTIPPSSSSSNRPRSKERIGSPTMPAKSSLKSPSPKRHSVTTATPNTPAAITVDIHSPTAGLPQNLPISSIDYDEFVKEHTTYAIQENRKKLEQLHLFVMKTLEQERKVYYLLGSRLASTLLIPLSLSLFIYL